MKYIKFFEELTSNDNDPAVGDTVYINYTIPGTKDHEPTPVKITEIKGSGRNVVYMVSHNVEMSQFKNAPDMAIRRSDIIGSYKGVSTPVGPSWVASNPNINTGVNQVSNDMYL